MTQSTNSTSDGEALRVLFDRFALGLRTALPAVVVAVSADGTTVDVQPAVSLLQTLDGAQNELPLPVIRGVPLHVMGSAALGLFVTVPVSAGDDGLLIVADRAIDNFQHGSGIQAPPLMKTPRHHDLTDAMFIPGLQRLSGAVTGFPVDAVQLQNRAGTCVLSLKADSIHAKVPGGAKVDVSGDTVAITGKLTVSTSIASPSIQVNGKELKDHKHSGVTVGSSQTGPNV